MIKYLLKRKKWSLVYLLVGSAIAGQAQAYITCEGHCNAYWETTSTVYSSGSTLNETRTQAHNKCYEQKGIVRHREDCIDHGSYYNCTLICSHPVQRDTSASAYGENRQEASSKISNYCQSYYSSYKNEQNFNVRYSVGACR